MFGKAWGWLTARLGSQPQGRLRFSVHRHPMYPSSWGPVAVSDQPPRLQIKVHLEASNMAAEPCWITGAEIDGLRASETVIGVRDARTGKFAHDNPLPPRHLATVSLDFLIDGHSHPTDEPFRATLILTDHLGERHPVKVTMH